jgi:hypothetical protein
MSAHNQVLISEYTYKYVKDEIQAVQVGARQFKGKQNEVIVYEVISIEKPVNAIIEPKVVPEVSSQPNEENGLIPENQTTQPINSS